jgi:hypothetical protein
MSCTSRRDDNRSQPFSSATVRDADLISALDQGFVDVYKIGDWGAGNGIVIR